MVPYVIVVSLTKLEKPYVAICCYMPIYYHVSIISLRKLASSYVSYAAICTHISYVTVINLMIRRMYPWWGSPLAFLHVCSCRISIRF